MPLIVETSAGGSDWTQAGVLNPGDREGSLSDNRRDGWRYLVLFRCEPARSVVYLDRVPLDFAIAEARVVIPQDPRGTGDTRPRRVIRAGCHDGPRSLLPGPVDARRLGMPTVMLVIMDTPPSRDRQEQPQ